MKCFPRYSPCHYSLLPMLGPRPNDTSPYTRGAWALKQEGLLLVVLAQLILLACQHFFLKLNISLFAFPLFTYFLALQHETTCDVIDSRRGHQPSPKMLKQGLTHHLG